MKTEDLILSFAADPKVAPLRWGRPVALFAAMLIAGAGLYLASMGLRPGFAASFLNPVTLAKSLVPGGVAVVALLAALRTARPDGVARAGLLWLAVPVLAALVIWALMVTPVGDWPAAVRGHTSIKCVSSILLIGALPLSVLLAALRRGASTRPVLTGTLAGLASGASAAAGYALSCGEDNPLFYVTWYGLAITAMTAAGALIGARVLRW